MLCNPQDLQAVKVALDKDASNLGVGVLHGPSGQIHLIPFDDLPLRGGHAEFVGMLNLAPSDCKGFVIAKQRNTFLTHNISHLNGSQGQAGSLQMPSSTFADIEQALKDAGL